MRYSFHGKVRATGQQVDGYVEAGSSTEAIDRLADQGIIGVHTVRPEAKKPRNPVTFGGEELYEEDEAPKKVAASAASAAAAAPALPVPAPQPIYIPVPTPAPAVATDTATQVVLGQLVAKLATLLEQVEKVLSRPQQIVYQSGPARGGGGDGSKRKARQVNEAQDSTLRAIFQTNMDLRRSLDKLSTVVTNGASNGVSTPAGPQGTGSGGTGSGGTGSGNGTTGQGAGSGAGQTGGTRPAPAAGGLPGPRDSGSPKPVSSTRERLQPAQPAA